MRVYYNIADFNVKKPVITIGAFDGVHIGHNLVIDNLKSIAKKCGGETVVLTFYPHPRLVLNPEESEKSLRLLTTNNEQAKLFEKAGIQNLIIYPFTVELSQMSYGEFVKKVLVEELKVHTLVVGYDNKLGKNREGTYANLLKMTKVYGFEIQKLDSLLSDDINISSTKIRNALNDGNVAVAEKYLGYKYKVEGLVVEGRQLGRTIQFPTANIKVNDRFKLIPKDGVYVVKVEVEGKLYFGMLNIGIRPTVNINRDDKTIEIHIFEFSEDIYAKNISIEFIDKIRDEQKFNSVEELRLQLEKDKISALEIISR